MFSKMKKIGLALVVVGFICLLGIAGTDDVNMLRGAAEPFGFVLIKGMLALGVMGLGAVMIGGDAE